MQRLFVFPSFIPPKHHKKITFLIVGGILFLLDFGVTVTTYHIFGLKAGYASALGFLASFLMGFILNKNVVFKHTHLSRFSLGAQVTLYLSLAFINLLVTSSLVNLFVDHGVRIEYAKPIMVITAACWNYVILGKFIFSHKIVS